MNSEWLGVIFVLISINKTNRQWISISRTLAGFNSCDDSYNKVKKSQCYYTDYRLFCNINILKKIPHRLKKPTDNIIKNKALISGILQSVGKVK